MGLITEMTDFIFIIVVVIGMFVGRIVGLRLNQEAEKEGDYGLKLFFVAGSMLAGSLALFIIVALAIYSPFILVAMIAATVFIYTKIKNWKKNKA
jgi:hypothetical protein